MNPPEEEEVPCDRVFFTDGKWAAFQELRLDTKLLGNIKLISALSSSSCEDVFVSSDWNVGLLSERTSDRCTLT